MLKISIINDLFYRTVMRDDFKRNPTENFLEMSRIVRKMLLNSELSYDIVMRPEGFLFRNEFQLKVVHVQQDSQFFVGGDPQKSEIKEIEYVAFRYTSMNGRIRYVDWEGNPESWR